MVDREEVESALRELIRTTKGPGEWDRSTREPSLRMGLGSGEVVFVDDGLSALDHLKALVSGNALGSGGPHPTVVQGWAAQACREARGDVDGAVERFVARLDEPILSWRVLAPYDDIRLPDGYESLDVAGCEVRAGAPPDVDLQVIFGSGSVMDDLATSYEGMVMVTEVRARDQSSAEVAAIDRFESARAILAAANGSALRSTPDALLVREDGAWGTSGGDSLLLPWPALNPRGSAHAWADGWHELAGAAGDPGKMAEWPRRVLAAIRWLHRSSQSWWTAERIAACFAALEALTLPDTIQGRRGKELARRITRLAVLSGHDADWQRAWLRDLYREERTAAIHIGAAVDRDLDADSLENLTRFVVRWGVRHLSPFHRAPNEPCATISEAFDRSAHGS